MLLQEVQALEVSMGQATKVVKVTKLGVGKQMWRYHIHFPRDDENLLPL